MSASNHLGHYFRSRRLEQGLSLGEAARRLGYINISKGARRIQQFEDVGFCTNDLLERLTEILGVDRSLVEELVARDRAEYVSEWEQWVNEPVPMKLVVRYIPGVYGERRVPPEITTPEQATAYGQELARTMRLKVCVELSRRVSVYIDENGTASQVEATPENDPRPFMQIGKQRFRISLER